MKFVQPLVSDGLAEVEVVYESAPSDQPKKKINVFDREDTPQPKNEKSIVRDVDIDPKHLIDEAKIPTNLFAGRTQRVREQTRVVETGQSQNSSSRQGANSLPGGQPNFNNLTDVDSQDSDGVGVPQNKSYNPNNDILRVVPGGAQRSQYSHALPEEIKIGEMTVLNTDQHLFYSFYARFGDLVRYRWIRRARQAIRAGVAQGRKIDFGDVYTTQLEVILDANGVLQKIIVVKSSDWPELDQAPIDAIREVGEFRNPHPQMVRDDNTIRVHIAYHVQIAPPRFL